MELRYLREFSVLARVLKYQEAAEMLFISQSTLSKHIMTMEKELGEMLFIRNKRNVQLTAFGARFLPYAERILAVEEEYTGELLQDPKGRGRVAIGHIPMVTLYTLTRFLAVFRKKYPDYEYAFRQADTALLFEWLQQKKLDFVLTDSEEMPEGAFKRTVYTEDHLVVVLPAGHPLAQCERLAPEQLAGETIIRFSGNEEILRKLAGDEQEQRFRSFMTVDKEQTLIDLVAQEMGMSLLTRRLAEHHLTEHVVLRPLDTATKYRIYLIHAATPRHAQLLKELTAYLKQRLEERE